MKEALEVGATTLLLDEDTCASNFMHRDARMRVRCCHSGFVTGSLRLPVSENTATAYSGM